MVILNAYSDIWLKRKMRLLENDALRNGIMGHLIGPTAPLLVPLLLFS
jgi:hypothetical protein